ncbi:MAG: DnaJ domain-containing protein [Anaerolineales bacterium]|nr:DnaJ domain-containing protein [Anaerolineales bacterium]
MQQARLAHPDNNPQDEQAAQHFNEVNSAYRMLKSCAEYDRRATAPTIAAADYRCDFEQSAKAGVLVVSISRSSELVARGKTA